MKRMSSGRRRFRSYSRPYPDAVEVQACAALRQERQHNADPTNGELFMNEESFIEQHYARHAKHFETDLVDEERKRISASWLDETTADYWRHSRAYECAQILASGNGDAWLRLTVGDGRWGLDSVRIRKKGLFVGHADGHQRGLLCRPRQGTHRRLLWSRTLSRLSFTRQFLRLRVLRGAAPFSAPVCRPFMK